MRSIEFSEALLTRYNERCFKEMHYERSAFDCMSAKLLSVILDDVLRSETQTCFKSALWLSRLTRSTRKMVRSRIKHLARYGIIRILAIYNDETGINEANHIVINPILIGIFKAGSALKNLASFVDHYVKVGIARLNFESDVQGFFTDVLVGKEEKETGARISWQQRLMDFATGEKEKAAKKQKENLEWAEKSNEFVGKAASVWLATQKADGYNDAEAIWAGDVNSLGPTAKRERQELVKVFQKYGGFDAGLAWYIFCASSTSYDNKGKLIFDLKAPHRQFVTIDKKPSHFAKHFTTILNDRVFALIRDNNLDGILDIIKTGYGHLLNIKPRYLNNVSAIDEIKKYVEGNGENPFDEIQLNII